MGIRDVCAGPPLGVPRKQNVVDEGTVHVYVPNQSEAVSRCFAQDHPGLTQYNNVSIELGGESMLRYQPADPSICITA